MSQKAGVLVVLKDLLGSSKKAIRKEVAWSLSNFTTEALIESGIADRLIFIMVNDDDWEVRKEASWAVANCIGTASPREI